MGAHPQDQVDDLRAAKQQAYQLLQLGVQREAASCNGNGRRSRPPAAAWWGGSLATLQLTLRVIAAIAVLEVLRQGLGGVVVRAMVGPRDQPTALTEGGRLWEAALRAPLQDQPAAGGPAAKQRPEYFPKPKAAAAKQDTWALALAGKGLWSASRSLAGTLGRRGLLEGAPRRLLRAGRGASGCGWGLPGLCASKHKVGKGRLRGALAGMCMHTEEGHPLSGGGWLTGAARRHVANCLRASA